jgi:hypothetical protein
MGENLPNLGTLIGVCRIVYQQYMFKVFTKLNCQTMGENLPNLGTLFAVGLYISWGAAVSQR